jgi:hypothetical protein
MINQADSLQSTLHFAALTIDSESLVMDALVLLIGMESITHIWGQPRVYGFNDHYYARRIAANEGSLMDSGANICITNTLGSLWT